MNENHKLQLMDRLYIISDGFDSNIINFVGELEIKNEKFLQKLEETSENLGELYQLIGNLK